MNVTNVASDIIRPTNSWDEDVDNYHINQSAVYREYIKSRSWSSDQPVLILPIVNDLCDVIKIRWDPCLIQVHLKVGNLPISYKL